MFIKGRRSRIGISQEGLAERSRLHRTYDIERGERNFSSESIRKLSIASTKRLEAGGDIIKPVNLCSLSEASPQLNFQWAGQSKAAG